MNNDRDQWIGEVLNSMRGSSRAQPSPDVWASIESKLSAEAAVVSLRRLRMAAAAAILVLLLNGLVLRHYVQDQGEEMASETVADQGLISRYNLYD